MRSITITYQYDGDELVWQQAIDGFVNALDADPDAARFSYQVAVADDGVTRIHWGRWDTPETLEHVHAQAYFKTFAAKVTEFSGGARNVTGADIKTRTANW
ncbi:hypothetical protein [Shimia sp.]|uniref:hypothetical protein n=1 Tax=Shimia sp. TaxID=1954381 RepID=UPI003297EDA7